MARKSRKHPLKAAMMDVRSTVWYIRLSFANKDVSCSVENQKLIIEQWGAEHETPIKAERKRRSGRRNGQAVLF